MGLPTFMLFQAIMDDNNGTYKDLLGDEGRRRRDRRIPLAALKNLNIRRSITTCTQVETTKRC